MATADKETLKAEIEDLVAKVKPQYDLEKQRVRSEGRPFAGLQWVMGVPDNGKYPSGPAYLVSEHRTTAYTGVKTRMRRTSSQDVLPAAHRKQAVNC